MPSQLKASETEATLLTEIRKLHGSPELGLFKKWLEALLEGSKEELVTCPPNALDRVQGEALAYRNMLRKLDRMAYVNEAQLRK